MLERTRFDSEIQSLAESGPDRSYGVDSHGPEREAFSFSQACLKSLREKRVAVIGGGLAGLMAARKLGQHGVEVAIFEGRPRVGGRVLSSHNFSPGRVTEFGAELIGSFHTTWLKLAREYGIAMISRTDDELYQRAGLVPKLRLDSGSAKALPARRLRQLEDEMDAVLRRIAETAVKIFKVAPPSEPWRDSQLTTYDNMSVATALRNLYNVSPKSELWKALEHLIVNDEVAPLEDMNFLGLLCKVRAGQGPRLNGDQLEPDGKLTGYWKELEIFRCADGCQKLADVMAAEIKTKYKAKIFLKTAVREIAILDKMVWIGFRPADKTSDEVPTFLPYDYVILTAPPTVWPGLAVSSGGSFDAKSKQLKGAQKISLETEIGRIGMGPCIKHFSSVSERFWIKDNPPAAPSGGTSTLGQIWEGTDNQTRIDPKQVKQGIVLSVFAGPIRSDASRKSRVPSQKEIEQELQSLYQKYSKNVIKTKYADWPKERFIKTGYASPEIGQIFKVRDKLIRPLRSRLFFAGEHTQMDFFGYMEGALRSGERAAENLMKHSCGTGQVETRVA